MANSIFSGMVQTLCVVNCFQISNFVLWQTAVDIPPVRIEPLWIAFKLVILSYGKQHFGLDSIADRVVNCFQISNFVLWQTAQKILQLASVRLWIAFKLVILSYGKQHFTWEPIFIGVVNCFQISNFVLWQTANKKNQFTNQRCELLSN